MKTVLFLNENSISKPFTVASISGKELRLRASIQEIDAVVVLAKKGQGVLAGNSATISALEKKIFVHHLPKLCPYYLSTICLFVQGMIQITRQRPAIIEAESPLISGAAAIMLGAIFKIPTLIEVRVAYEDILDHKLTWLPKSIKRVLVKRIMKLVLNRATVIVANSNTLKQQLHQIGFSSVIINPGLQYTPLQPARLNSNSPPVIGYLGRLASEKGAAELIEAANIIHQNHPSLKFKLLIAGKGEEEATLQKMINRYSLQQIATLVGQVQNYTFLKKLDILVNPNTVKAPLEMVNAEAAFMGVPVVCFGQDHIPETVLHQHTGLKITQASPEALAKALIFLLENKSLRHRFGRQAKKFAVQNFDFNNQSQILKKVYQDLEII